MTEEQKSEAQRLAGILRGIGPQGFMAKQLDRAATELERLQALVEARRGPTKEEIEDYLFKQDAVLVARATYREMSYRARPIQSPLPAERIEELCTEVGFTTWSEWDGGPFQAMWLELARRIERAHGIGGADGR